MHRGAAPIRTHHRYYRFTDGVVWAVAHSAFDDITPKRLKDLCGNAHGSGVVMDVKGVLTRDAVEAVGLGYWSL